YANKWGALAGFATLARGVIVEGADKRQLAPAVNARPELILLRLVGMCLLDFAELESGTHVWQGTATAPELVRVRVVSAHGAPALGDIAADFRTRKAAFDKIAMGPGRAHENPSRLLPIARKVRFDPPRAGLAALELEDYRMGHGGTFYARALAD